MPLVERKFFSNQMTDTAGTHTFGYDELQRLTSAVHPAGQAAESYQYDEVGNRTASHLTNTYNTLLFNRVVQIGNTTFSYDNNGNLKTKAAGNLITTYDYDYENRLMSVHLPTTPPKTIHYQYDALGRRIEREDASTNAWQRYTYDGWEVRSEENSDGSWVSYVNGDEIDAHLLQRSKSPGSQVIYEYYLSDHQGSLRSLTDANGNVISGNTYDTFGNRTGTIATRFGYTGREHDSDTGLMYYRARWYDSASGRFISEDPIGLAGGINLYAYVGNNSLNLTDPTGNNPVLLKLLKGLVTGGKTVGRKIVNGAGAAVKSPLGQAAIKNAAIGATTNTLVYLVSEGTKPACARDLSVNGVVRSIIAGGVGGALGGAISHALGRGFEGIVYGSILGGGAADGLGQWLGNAATGKTGDSIMDEVGANALGAALAAPIGFYGGGYLATQIVGSFMGDLLAWPAQLVADQNQPLPAACAPKTQSPEGQKK